MKFYAEIDNQNRIKPLYNSDYEILKKVHKNKPLELEAVQKRNPKFHRKMFALFNLGLDNQELTCMDSDGVQVSMNLDHYRKFVTIKAGFYDIVQTDKGALYIAQSISYAGMGTDEFEDLFSKVLDVVAKQLEIKPFEIRNQIDDFM